MENVYIRGKVVAKPPNLFCKDFPPKIIRPIWASEEETHVFIGHFIILNKSKIFIIDSLILMISQKIIRSSLLMVSRRDSMNGLIESELFECLALS